MTRALARDLIADAVSRTLFRRVLSLVAFAAALCGLRLTLAAWLVRGFFGMARVWVAFPGLCTDGGAGRAHRRFDEKVAR